MNLISGRMGQLEGLQLGGFGPTGFRANWGSVPMRHAEIGIGREQRRSNSCSNPCSGVLRLYQDRSKVTRDAKGRSG